MKKEKENLVSAHEKLNWFLKKIFLKKDKKWESEEREEK